MAAAGVTPEAAAPTEAGKDGAEAAPSETPAAEPSLLDKFDAKAKEKADAPAADANAAAKDGEPKDGKVAEAAPADADAAPALEPVDYFKDVKLPESITLDDTQRNDVTSALDLLRSGKHAEGVQKLMDAHNQAMTAYAEQVNRNQWAAFNQVNRDWQTAAMADPQIGGSGFDTAMGAIARMRDAFVSNARQGTPQYIADRKQFDDFLKATGAGNHPAFLKLLHNVARRMDEPALPPAEARPTNNAGRPPGPRRLTYSNSNPGN
ncbi:MAG: hypothetical protein KGL39_57945 [Patescibacteria group bacterium]|nr:hypothetical protein [Patescibacteria group bacterium]